MWFTEKNAGGCAAACLIIFASTLPFLTGVSDQFVFDDVPAVQQNGDTVGLGGLANLTRHDYWGGPLDSPTSHKSWRPLTTASFLLQVNLSFLSSNGQCRTVYIL